MPGGSYSPRPRVGRNGYAVQLRPAGVSWASTADFLLLLLLLRGDEMRCLNEDHSMVPVIERQFPAGGLTPEQADNDPRRDKLLTALPGRHSPDLGDSPYSSLPLEIGEKIIIASEGIPTRYLPEILRSCQSEFCARSAVAGPLQLIARKRRKAQDNSAITKPANELKSYA
jgi:hypothetical protein